MWLKLKKYFYLILTFCVIFAFLKVLYVYQEFVLVTFKEKPYRALAMGIPLSFLMLIDVTAWNYRWGSLGALIAKILKYLFGILGWLALISGFVGLIGLRPFYEHLISLIQNLSKLLPFKF